MKIEEIKQLLANKINNLEGSLCSAKSIGDIATIGCIENEIQETKLTSLELEK
jgi:hypothetical protein